VHIGVSGKISAEVVVVVVVAVVVVISVCRCEW